MFSPLAHSAVSTQLVMGTSRANKNIFPGAEAKDIDNITNRK